MDKHDHQQQAEQDMATPAAENRSAATESVTANPWAALRRFTAARIALGRSGVSLPTQPQLAFQLAHAQARDAVHLPLDAALLRAQLHEQGVCSADEVLELNSAAADRLVYLQRPDLGRTAYFVPSEASIELSLPADLVGEPWWLAQFKGRRTP